MDLSQSKFGRLQPVQIARREPIASGTRIIWLCRCDCGRETEVWAGALRCGSIKSCGCLRRERVAAKNTSHGLSGTPEYEVWCSMKKRCANPRHKSYSAYGGRGISVCERWTNSFKFFIDDMGLRPSPKHSIERRDTSGNYEPNNCYWATKVEQYSNMRKNVYLSHNGITRTLAEWSRELGMPHSTILARLAKGWSVERALATPPRRW